MRAVVQLVKAASVAVDGAVKGRIGLGYLVLLGIEENDGQKDLDYISEKLLRLRVFEDADGKMNRSILEAGGSVLLVSQFTLYGDARKGRRPSFTRAARPEKALPLYEAMIARLRETLPVETGEFGAHMQVSLVNDGPVTILLDSERTF